MRFDEAMAHLQGQQIRREIEALAVAAAEITLAAYPATSASEGHATNKPESSPPPGNRAALDKLGDATRVSGRPPRSCAA